MDFLPSFYVVGVIAIFLGRQGKRIGDYAAGTMVVQEARAADPGRTPTTLAGLPDAEGTLIAEFLARRSGLSPGARAEVARQLADRLAQRHSAPRPDDAEAFLERLARDGLR